MMRKKFRGYGPYGYDVKELIARARAVRMRQQRKPNDVARFMVWPPFSEDKDELLPNLVLKIWMSLMS